MADVDVGEVSGLESTVASQDSVQSELPAVLDSGEGSEKFVGQEPAAPANVDEFVSAYLASEKDAASPDGEVVEESQVDESKVVVPTSEVRLAALEEQIRQLANAFRQPQVQPHVVPHGSTKSIEDRVEERVSRYVKAGYQDDATLREFVHGQVSAEAKGESLEKELVELRKASQQARHEAQVARTQSEMDRAFAGSKLLNKLATDNPKLGTRLYEAAFAVWLATPQDQASAPGAVKAIEDAIDLSVKEVVASKLSVVKAKSKVKPITSAGGRGVSVATTEPGSNGKPKLKFKNPGNAINEAAEAAVRYFGQKARQAGGA